MLEQANVLANADRIREEHYICCPSVRAREFHESGFSTLHFGETRGSGNPLGARRRGALIRSHELCIGQRQA